MATSTAALDEREARIRQREKELAEQHRILAEEYRLLHAQRHAVPFEPPPEGFWMRLKRFMLGVSTSDFIGRLDDSVGGKPSRQDPVP